MAEDVWAAFRVKPAASPEAAPTAAPAPFDGP
ncbi:hypothetical protein FHU13_004482 [Methylobacterium sp. R2-1]|nr:hypothetical protein [Methylobacterium sp. R2-1]